MILYYTPGTCSLAPMIALAWCGLPYTLCRVAREERFGEFYRSSINPQSQVPALAVADNSIVTENAAVLLHIGDRTKAKTLVPQVATKDRDILHQWLSWLGSEFHVAHKPIFKASKFLDDEGQHETLKAKALENISAMLTRLDGIFANRKTLHPGGATVLDPYLFAMLRWSAKFLDHETLAPHVDSYRSEMAQDPSVRFCLAVESGEITEGGQGEGGGGFRGHVPLPT